MTERDTYLVDSTVELQYNQTRDEWRAMVFDGMDATRGEGGSKTEALRMLAAELEADTLLEDD